MLAGTSGLYNGFLGRHSGLPRVSHDIYSYSAFIVSLLSAESDIAHLTGVLANRSRTTARYPHRLPVQKFVMSHIILDLALSQRIAVKGA